MGLNVKITNDCKTIISKIKNAQGATTGTLNFTNGSASHSVDVGIANGKATVTTPTSTIGAENGVFHVELLVNGAPLFQGAVIGNCDVLCCLAKKVDKLLDCSADCSKCATELAEAQKIYLLMKSAETELSTMAGGPNNQSLAPAIIANAEKKYNKAVEICGGHCGCDC